MNLGTSNLRRIIDTHKAVVLWLDPDEGCYYMAKCTEFPGWGGDKNPTCIGGELSKDKRV